MIKFLVCILKLQEIIFLQNVTFATSTFTLPLTTQTFDLNAIVSCECSISPNFICIEHIKFEIHLKSSFLDFSKCHHYVQHFLPCRKVFYFLYTAILQAYIKWTYAS